MKSGQRIVDITAGAVNGILIIIFQSAYATLIFSGPLAKYLSFGLGYMLAGALVLGLIVSLTSSFSITITAPQDAPSAIMALAAGSIAVTMSSSGQASGIVFITVVVAMAATSIFTGVFLYVLGKFNLGNLIRFIPYPVVGGFLAGTGWVLIRGALGISTGIGISINSISSLFEAAALSHWVPALIFALLLLFARKRFKHFLVMPAMILAAIFFFYLILFLSGSSIDGAREHGWLLSAFPDGISWRPVLPSDLLRVDWPILLEQAGSLGTIAIISTISLLLNASGMELIERREVDLNHELRSTGLANIAGGASGSLVGYFSLSLTSFAYRLGARKPLAGIIAASLCGMVLISGAGISAYFPKPLLSGLLLFLGLIFLVEWLYYGIFRLPKTEYGLVVLILMTIAFFGFLKGMLVGTLIAVVLFVINYSRVNVVKHVLSGATFRSNVDRAPAYRSLLNSRGDESFILKLQGYIFFGTANAVFQQVKERMYEAGREDLKFVVLDFQLVNGLDSSALYSFEKMKMLADSKRVHLVFTNLSTELIKRFEMGELLGNGENPVRLFPDLDRGVEWIENQLLISVHGSIDTVYDDIGGEKFFTSLYEMLPDATRGRFTLANFMEQMLEYLEERSFPREQILIAQNQTPSGLFIIETGQVTVQLENGKDAAFRLRSMGAGAVIGELGLYLGLPASASVIAVRDCEAFFLSIDALKRMESDQPHFASALHKYIASILGERLSFSNRSLKALLD